MHFTACLNINKDAIKMDEFICERMDGLKTFNHRNKSHLVTDNNL